MVDAPVLIMYKSVLVPRPKEDEHVPAALSVDILLTVEKVVHKAGGLGGLKLNIILAGTDG